MSFSERLPNGLYVIRQELAAGQSFEVPQAWPLLDEDTTKLWLGVDRGVVFGQVWPSKRGLVHLMDTSHNNRYGNVTVVGDRHKKTGYTVPVRMNEESVIGRAHQNQAYGLSLPGSASRHHFTVKGRLGHTVVRNLQPKYSTTVSYVSDRPSVHALAGAPFLPERYGEPNIGAPAGYYGGAPIASKNTFGISGSIVMGSNPNHSFIIDGESTELGTAYETMRATIPKGVRLTAYAAAIMVRDQVRKIMMYDEAMVDNLNSRHHGDEVRLLSAFVMANSAENVGSGIGVHFAATAAYLGERLMYDGAGIHKSRLERNILTGRYWATFADHLGNRLLVDPAHNVAVQNINAAVTAGHWQYTYAS